MLQVGWSKETEFEDSNHDSRQRYPAALCPTVPTSDYLTFLAFHWKRSIFQKLHYLNKISF